MAVCNEVDLLRFVVHASRGCFSWEFFASPVSVFDVQSLVLGSRLSVGCSGLVTVAVIHNAWNHDPEGGFDTS